MARYIEGIPRRAGLPARLIAPRSGTALIAIGNSAAPDLLPALRPHLADPSPLVRAMAVWALSRLAPPEAFRQDAATFRPGESDPAVQEEWRAGSQEPSSSGRGAL